MAAFRRQVLGCLVTVAAFPIVLAIFSGFWLPVVGTSLENAGPPQKADIALVLAGDFFGNRILTAAKAARDGYAPSVLVSGPSGAYGFYESDLAIPFAVKHGFPQSMFIAAPHNARSTQEELAIIVPQLRQRGAHTVMLVTSDFHTGRASKLFRVAAPDLKLVTLASPDTDFQLNQWWKTREGRKNVFLEWAKTVATWFGL